MTQAPTPLPRLWFGPPPELLPDERWVSHHPANRSQGKRAVGGGLHFTTHRALFCPNAVDARLGGKPWSCALTDIERIGVEPGRLALTELFSGGLRSRLRLDIRGSGPELFVVSSPETLAADLRTSLAAASPQPPAAELPPMHVVERKRS